MTEIGWMVVAFFAFIVGNLYIEMLSIHALSATRFLVLVLV